MLKLPSFQTFSSADLQRIFPSGIADGHYTARVVISPDGQLSEIISVHAAQADAPSQMLSMQAGAEPVRLDDRRYSINAHLVVLRSARFPGCLRFIPNVVKLPEGDYVFRDSPAKRTCFSVSNVPSDRCESGEFLGTVALSDDGHAVDSYQIFSKVSQDAILALCAQSHAIRRVPAIISDKYASLLYIPVPLN